MKIEINNRTKNKIDLRLVRQVVNKFTRAYKIKAKEISLALVGDAEIKKLNQAYRKLNQPTDILSFVGEGDFWGELVIDYKRIKKQATQFDHSVKAELIFILVHGLLHLAGYDDDTEPKRLEMIKRGEEFMKNNF